MPKNVFDICVIMMRDKTKQEPLFSEKIEDYNIRMLSDRAKTITLNEEWRLGIYGDIDVRNLVTDKNDSLDDSFFEWLVVFGNFTCSKYSKNFPVIVAGRFDCSGLGKDYIDKDTFIPLTREINCAYSIRDLDVFMDIFDDDLRKKYIETLIVEPKLVKKKFLVENEEHLINVLNFVNKYPKIKVVDVNGVLLSDTLPQAIKEIEERKNKQDKKELAQVYEHFKEFFEAKVDEKHLDKNDIYIKCRQNNPEFDNIPDDELKRLIQIVLSDRRRNGIKKTKMRREDGVNIVCIDVADLPLVYTDLQLLLQERADSKIMEEKPVINQREIIEPVKEISESVLQPVKIKKYITFAQYKDVIGSSGLENANMVLRAISEININPLEMQFLPQVNNKKLFILKDGELSLSDTVKKETGACIVQSIDSSLGDDKKRLVWRVADGPDGLIFVCVKFFPDHSSPKVRHIYRQICKNVAKKVKYTDQDLKGFLDVDDLLANSGGGKPGAGESKEQDNDNPGVLGDTGSNADNSYAKISNSAIKQALAILKGRL